MLCRESRYLELRYTEQIFSEKDACLTGDLISSRYVEVYVLARVVISRADLHMRLALNHFESALPQIRSQVWWSSCNICSASC